MARARLDKAPTFDEIARQVREAMGMKSLSGQAVGAWFAKGQEPDTFAVLPALASALHADPAEIAWGEGWQSVFMGNGAMQADDAAQREGARAFVVAEQVERLRDEVRTKHGQRASGGSRKRR